MTRIAYATVGWLVAFVAWHLPFTFGWNPFGDEMTTVFHVYNLTLITMAALGAVAVLATVRPWGRRVPRWVLLTPLTIGSVLLVLRGVPGFVEFLGQVSGIAPAGLFGGDVSVGAKRWAGYAINLFFFAGAVLLVPTTVWFWRSQPRRVP